MIGGAGKAGLKDCRRFLRAFRMAGNALFVALRLDGLHAPGEGFSFLLGIAAGISSVSGSLVGAFPITPPENGRRVRVDNIRAVPLMRLGHGRATLQGSIRDNFSRGESLFRQYGFRLYICPAPAI